MNADFRRFRITAKVPESAIITSFYLAPIDNEPLWQAAPGQYLTLRIPTDSVDSFVLRTYSISADVTQSNETRITVKREAAPPHSPNAPIGVGSCWLHDQAEVGTELDIAAPRGRFFLDETSSSPVMLLSGGVGLTPLLSMLHSLVKTRRQAWFLHGCDNGIVHAMSAEVNELVKTSNGRIQQHVCYRKPVAEDLRGKDFHSDGYIDNALLESLRPSDPCDWYLCGPTAFMVAQYQHLLELDVPEERIAYEFFGKAQSLPALVAERAKETQPIKPTVSLAPAGADAPDTLKNLAHLTNPDAWAVDSVDDLEIRTSSNTTEVVFERSSITAHWSDTTESILELAEQQGLDPDFSCRSGICGSCMCAIKEGDVEYFEEPLDKPDDGYVLICCSRPKGRVVLDL